MAALSTLPRPYDGNRPRPSFVLFSGSARKVSLAESGRHTHCSLGDRDAAGHGAVRLSRCADLSGRSTTTKRLDGQRLAATRRGMVVPTGTRLHSLDGTRSLSAARVHPHCTGLPCAVL